MFKKTPIRIWLVFSACVLFIGGIGSIARMFLGAKAEVQRAQQAKAQHDSEAMVRHWRRAMAYYLPGNPWVRQAKDSLWQTASEAIARGDEATALNALYQLRGAILSLRGVYQPFSECLPSINQQIVALLAHQQQGSDNQKNPSDTARFAQRLANPPAPHPVWTGLGLLGFFIWTIGALGLLLWGINSDLTIIRHRFWPLLLLILTGLVIFGVGLYQA